MDVISGRHRYNFSHSLTDALAQIGKVAGAVTRRVFASRHDRSAPAIDDISVRIAHSLNVNGTTVDIEMSPDTTLIDVLRGQLGLKGTKAACGRGECGACTVLIDGSPVLACLTLAARTEGDVRTIEDLAEEFVDLRTAFADHGAFQCGFCTSGQIVHASALLKEGVPADREAAEHFVRHRMSGNICRCTGYNGIVQAILSVAARQAPDPYAPEVDVR